MKNQPEKQNIKVTLSYDGTEYNGYQTQKNGIGVEDIIDKTLAKIHGSSVAVICAGRTDSGVHAEGQVINFFTDKINMSKENWIGFFNSELPSDIRVMDVDFVSPDFNARRSAKAREYWYRIVKGYTVSAIISRYTVACPIRDLNIDLIREYTSYLVGIHDFTSFCSTKDVNPHKIREIKSIVTEEENGIITIKIIGNAFLYNMIRIIIGTIFMLTKEGAQPEKMKELLDAKNRKLTGSTAPAKGLIFKKVYY